MVPATVARVQGLAILEGEDVRMIRRNVELEGKLIDLPNGIRLSYAEQGEVSGLPVLLLHGVTDSWRSFAPLLSHLPPSLRAAAVSQRGHGDSHRPAAGYLPNAFAECLRRG